MHVLLVNKFLYPRGGAERAVLSLGDALRARGHEVSWFGMRHPDNSVDGAHVELVRQRDYHARTWGRFRDAAAMLYSWEARRRFDAFLVRARPDIVHAHNIYHQLTPSILDAARARAVPIVLTVHDYKLVCPRYDMLRHGVPCDACVKQGPVACLRYRCGGSWGRSLLLTAESALHRSRGSYDPVRRFLCPSRFVMRTLERAGWDATRMRHLPNFAPSEVASSVSGSPAPDAPRFVYAGRLSPEKGLATLVKVLGQLERGTCVVCGAGALEPMLLQAARALPEGRLELRGHLDPPALSREIERAQFCVLPSECFENAPLAVLDAMYAARAVVASDIGGIPELVEHDVTGVLVPAGDVSAWVGALRAALDAPGRMQALGVAARRRVEERFGFGAHVDALETHYREVVA